MRAEVWQAWNGRWRVMVTRHPRRKRAARIRDRLTPPDALTPVCTHYPTHAEALSHALRMVGLAPEGER